MLKLRKYVTLKPVYTFQHWWCFCRCPSYQFHGLWCIPSGYGIHVFEKKKSNFDFLTTEQFSILLQFILNEMKRRQKHFWIMFTHRFIFCRSLTCVCGWFSALPSPCSDFHDKTLTFLMQCCLRALISYIIITYLFYAQGERTLAQSEMTKAIFLWEPPLGK